MEIKKNIEQPYNVWFISDLHIAHKNILRHQRKRIEVMGLKDEDDIENHDKWVINMWLNTVKRNDHVYVLGDMILSSQQHSLHILHKLKSVGCQIHLIVGNHDKSTQKMYNMFNSIDLIKVAEFKKSVFTFLDENFTVVMCHYPMVTWNRKAHGTMHLFGHIHENAPHINFGVTEGDLMLNVGLDAPMANYGLINLKDIYQWYKEKLNGMKPKEYINFISDKNPKFVR